VSSFSVATATASTRFLCAALATLGVFALGCQNTHNVARAPSPYNVDANDLGLEGYDPVTYFPEGGGVPRFGSSDVTARYQSVTYRFVGDANRRRFVGNPERYVPHYGGWCAFGMSEGKQRGVAPKSFLIDGGQLLLFFDGTFLDGRSKWLQRDAAVLRQRADRAWSTFRSR